MNNRLIAELLERLDSDDRRGQTTVLGPDFFKDNKKEFKSIRKQLLDDVNAPANRYVLIGVDPKTEEQAGNTVEVHETFIALHQNYEIGTSRDDLQAIVKKTGMDVVLVPLGIELRVVKVIKPKGGGR